ncbi:ecdysteroid 22-kinase family protein [Colwellia sp. E2M01]|uniref:ecdysteroid 22-kinase family protein n=1 Tax=Colwellia sp. E2M01 TaxID=2841561 RepID=UPI002091D58F|nr:ecdysteroid 22-kinase family protein [Colwellia sp. E2M01]
MLKAIQELLNDPHLTYTETLQALWSGYGQVSRYYSPKLESSVIVKSVTPPQQVNHPRGWHSDAGHQRKINSYKVEAKFYQHYAIHCKNACYVPQLIALSPTENNDNEQIIIMEDLQHLGFNDKNSSLSLTDIKVVINWLANFHARFIEYDANDLWPIGTYWHLATRQDEFNSMQNGVLKQAAHFIDNQLNNAKYQTVIHGDAKLANFCFGSFPINTASRDDTENHNKLEGKPTSQVNQFNQAKRVAAVDFQYVGKGVGVKDLAYFLGSCLTDNELTSLHSELLDYYFKRLSIACVEHKQGVDFSELEIEWRKLYSFANADFHRFLQGWSPEHQKINSYLQAQTNIALAEF